MVWHAFGPCRSEGFRAPSSPQHLRPTTLTKRAIIPEVSAQIAAFPPQLGHLIFPEPPQRVHLLGMIVPMLPVPLHLVHSMRPLSHEGHFGIASFTGPTLGRVRSGWASCTTLDDLQSTGRASEQSSCTAARRVRCKRRTYSACRLSGQAGHAAHNRLEQ